MMLQDVNGMFKFMEVDLRSGRPADNLVVLQVRIGTRALMSTSFGWSEL